MSRNEISRQEKFSGTKDVVSRYRFDEGRLERYLSAHISGFGGPLTVQQFKGGQSNPTYLLSTPNAKYVMRRKPPGKLLPSAHAVDREFRIISALYESGFPVPRTHLLVEDEDVLGTMFYVMDFVEGRLFWDPDLPSLPAEERGRIYDAMNQTIATLHQLDFAALGLSDYGKPGNYFARQVARWSKQYTASQTDEIVEMDKLMDWLPGNIPADDSTTIVHGDFRLDNMILHPHEPRVLAVLDWELSTLGHPLGDFSYHVMPWYMPEDVNIGGLVSLRKFDLKALGIPSQEEYVAAYCERTGRPMDGNQDFYAAYNLFRMAGILQGIAGRVRDGTASNEFASEMGNYVRPLAVEGWRFAQQAGAC